MTRATGDHAGSLIGGLPETQEMLERMLRSDVRYRFVIDLATLD